MGLLVSSQQLQQALVRYFGEKYFKLNSSYPINVWSQE